MRRPLLALGFAATLLIGGAMLLLIARPTSVTVRNDSAETLSEVSVTVQERRIEFPDLAPGVSARRWFRNTGADGQYSFVARRTDGTEIRQDEGYITSTTLFGSAEFKITPSGDVTFADGF